MKARPILFSGPMVRALLEGRKTQTRRIIKPQPEINITEVSLTRDGMGIGGRYELPEKCPYGQSGDLMWVRETWQALWAEADRAPPRGLKSKDGWAVGYAADEIVDRYDGETLTNRCKPSIHMPRWASRLTLEIMGVRVSRLQEISNEDAIAEGATVRARCCGFRKSDDGWSMDWSRVGTSSKWGHDGKTLSEGDLALASPQSAFACYINELHGGFYWSSKPEKPLWDENPWVWGLTFKVHNQNVDAFLQARDLHI